MSVKETTIIYSGYFPQNLLHNAPPGVQLIPLESSLGGLREQVQGYILGGDEKLTKRDFDQFPQLRCATFVGTGVESFIDIEEADRRGITVQNPPGLNRSALAQYSVKVALASRRRLQANVTRPDRAPVVGRALTAHRISVLGCGVIGRAVADIFSAHATVVDYVATRDKPDYPHGNRTTLESAMHSDVVINTLPLTPTSAGLLTGALLTTLPEASLFISVGDPGVFSPGALTELAVKRPDLDVVLDLPSNGEAEKEARAASEMTGGEWILTPHCAAATEDVWELMVRTALGKTLKGLGVINRD